jgi:hypothetical protein
MSPYVYSKSRYSSGIPVLDTHKPNLDRAYGHVNTAMPSFDLNDSYLNRVATSTGKYWERKLVLENTSPPARPNDPNPAIPK